MICRLPVLAPAMTEVGFETQFRWKFGESIAWIHLYAPVGPAFLVRRFECAVVSRAVEGDEFVETIAHSLESSLASIDDSVGAAGLAAAVASTTEELLGDFSYAVENISQSTTELTRGVILGSGRSLDIRIGTARQGKEGCDQNQFSHYGGSVSEERGDWQEVIG